MNKVESNDKVSTYIQKLKEENRKLTEQNEKTHKEMEELRKKNYFNGQVAINSTALIREENESLKETIFTLENEIEKLMCINNSNETKIEKLEDLVAYKSIKYDKEIYVTDAKKTVLLLHDEAETYRRLYDNLAEYIKELKKHQSNIELNLADSQNENMQLKMQLNSLKQERREAEIINRRKQEFQKEMENMHFDDQSNRPRPSGFSDKVEVVEQFGGNGTNENDSITQRKSSIASTPKKSNKNLTDKDSSKSPIKKISGDCFSEKISLMSDLMSKKEKNIETLEYLEILVSLGLSPELLNKLSKNKNCARLTEAIELLNKLVMDKNLQLRVLNEEYADLNLKNTQLNNDNMYLTKQLRAIERENKTLLEKLNKSFEEYKIDKSSITINNVNINAINPDDIKRVFPNSKKNKEKRVNSCGFEGQILVPMTTLPNPESIEEGIDSTGPEIDVNIEKNVRPKEQKEKSKPAKEVNEKSKKKSGGKSDLITEDISDSDSNEESMIHKRSKVKKSLNVKDKPSTTKNSPEHKTVTKKIDKNKILKDLEEYREHHKERKESKESKGVKDSKDHRESRDSKDIITETKETVPDSREIKEFKELNKLRDRIEIKDLSLNSNSNEVKPNVYSQSQTQMNKKKTSSLNPVSLLAKETQDILKITGSTLDKREVKLPIVPQ